MYVDFKRKPRHFDIFVTSQVVAYTTASVVDIKILLGHSHDITLKLLRYLLYSRQLLVLSIKMPYQVATHIDGRYLLGC